MPTPVDALTALLDRPPILRSFLQSLPELREIMNMSNDQAYHQAREMDERKRARLAVDPAARNAHTQLAAMHAVEATQAPQSVEDWRSKQRGSTAQSG
jgi:hypothetical protein